MRKKVFIMGLMAVVAVTWAAPSFAVRFIQGTVGEVTALDGAALGQVGFRFWSASPGGASLDINNNQSACRNARCLKNFLVNATLAAPGAVGGGGYVAGQEATSQYNADVPDQPYYQLADASMNAGGGNHIGYYGVQGVTGNNSGTGQFLDATCSGVNAQNCMGRIDKPEGILSPLGGASHGYGAGANEIRSIGGLNPVPNVKINSVTASADHTAGTVAHLSWNDPQLYLTNMRPSSTAAAPVTPVLGVALYKNDRTPCTDPTGGDPGWVKIIDKGLGQTTYDDSLVGATGACRYYCLKVRMIGPGGLPNEITTFECGVNSQAVSTDVTAVRITRFNAQYAGHGVVNVSWQSGVEGDLRGFKVTRGRTANGPFVAVSDTIPAAGDGHVYSVTDSVKSGAGKTYYYQLQIIARDGSITTSSPAAVSLPKRTTKNPGVR